MLGADVCEAFTRHGCEVLATGPAELDVTDSRQATQVVAGFAPQVVIHCAAYTDVDGSETDPDRAYRVNALGAGNVASACCTAGARLIAISTDFVFDGSSRTAYTEFDPIAPLGAYGRSKAAGEAMIRASCPRHQIVRTAWLYGVQGKCFPKTMLAAARKGSALRVVADQTGSPTFTADLAKALTELVEWPLFGTFHLVNSGQCTWHELAVETIRLAGITGVTVEPIGSSQWPTPARRPAYSVLRPYVWDLAGKAPLRSWREALADYVARLGRAEAQ
jgi:dTDP-4-dehydrorhamnose reductase